MASIYHEGVTCDPCGKNNFSGLRYKCLVCLDYDLCAQCFDTKQVSINHLETHPVQCIVPKSDYEIYFFGEPPTEPTKSLTCPVCGSLGFTEATLADHVSTDHPTDINDSSNTVSGVVCPICGLEKNQLVYDFASHLNMEHKTPRGHLDQLGIRGGRGNRCNPRASRGRRSQYSTVTSLTNLTAASNRDSAEHLVEILSQITGVRRAPGGLREGISAQTSASQIQQLQMQLQSSPPHLRADRDLRIIKRSFQPLVNNPSYCQNAASPEVVTANGNQSFVVMDQNSLLSTAMASGLSPSTVNNIEDGMNVLQNDYDEETISEDTNNSTQYLLAKCIKPVMTEAEQQEREILKADRSIFVQELLMQTGLLHGNH